MPYKRNCGRTGYFGGQYGRQPHLRLRKRSGMTLPSLTTLLVPPKQADLQISRPSAKHSQMHDAQGQQARQQSLISTSLQCTRRHSSEEHSSKVRPLQELSLGIARVMECSHPSHLAACL